MQNYSSLVFKTLERSWSKTFRRSKSKDEKSKKPVVCPPKPDAVYSGKPEMRERGICVVDTCDADKCFQEPRVVILGAGMAGLSAAARLSQRGINNFVVLEAYGRPGGRIMSSWIGDTIVELGAYWRPEAGFSSAVFNMIADEDPPRPGVPASENPRGLFSRAVGGKIPIGPSVTAYQKFRQIEKEAASIYCHGSNKTHGSLIDFISLRIQQELHEFPEDHQHDAARVMFGLVHMLTARCGHDTSYLCCDHLGCFMHTPGSDVHVPLGNVGMLAPILRQLPVGCIRYCRPVSNIYWGCCPKMGHRAIVCIADGEEYPADYVIITFSLGVLFENACRMFCPELPGSKIDAIRCLGYGYCCKVFMEYCRPFWYWQQTELNYKFCGGCGRSDWTNGVTAIEIMPYSKHVMCAWVVGPEALTLETLCDRDVAEGLTEMLRWASGCSTIPYPSSILRSSWGTDPFFRGSYSFESSDGSDGSAQRAMACPLPGPTEPVPPILLFAGEATVAGHFATVAGARLSGIREAERIVTLTRQFKGPPVLYSEEAQSREVKKCEATN